jgi:ABC-2 type transport system permease protein
METLHATPVGLFEAITGKIIPYIIVGYIQVALILLASWLIFGVPIQGSLVLLSTSILLFIIANLMVGITFSTLARNQMQAMQMIFFFLPSLFLSGFMFPFRGMPEWAQYLGELFPLTYFLRIVRGILLKSNGLPEILPEIWPIALFLTVAATEEQPYPA